MPDFTERLAYGNKLGSTADIITSMSNVNMHIYVVRNYCAIFRVRYDWRDVSQEHCQTRRIATASSRNVRYDSCSWVLPDVMDDRQHSQTTACLWLPSVSGIFPSATILGCAVIQYFQIVRYALTS